MEWLEVMVVNVFRVYSLIYHTKGVTPTRRRSYNVSASLWDNVNLSKEMY